MSIFTLTNADNLDEVKQFVSAGLIAKDKVVAWNCAFLKVMRLETELPFVMGKVRYERFICSGEPSIDKKRIVSPDVLNLDFVSQDIGAEQGRIENELDSIAETIRLRLKDFPLKRRFALIYTTLINENEIDCKRVLLNLDATDSVDNLPNKATSLDEKKAFVRVAIDKIFSKYNLIFRIEGEFEEKVGDIIYVFSIAVIARG